MFYAVNSVVLLQCHTEVLPVRLLGTDAGDIVTRDTVTLWLTDNKLTERKSGEVGTSEK